MPPKSAIEKPNAIASQEIHRDTIMKEKLARDLWLQKYGNEYCEKFREAQKVAERARAKVGFPSAFATDETIKPWSQMPPQLQKERRVQIESDTYGLWGIDLDGDLFDRTKHAQKKVMWD